MSYIEIINRNIETLHLYVHYFGVFNINSIKINHKKYIIYIVSFLFLFLFSFSFSYMYICFNNLIYYVCMFEVKAIVSFVLSQMICFEKYSIRYEQLFKCFWRVFFSYFSSFVSFYLQVFCMPHTHIIQHSFTTICFDKSVK